MTPRILEVLLRIDFDVATRGIDVSKALAGFDHLLEQEDLVCLLEALRLAPRLAGVLLAAAVVMLLQSRRAGGRKLRHANVLAVRLRRRHLPVDARDSAT